MTEISGALIKNLDQLDERYSQLESQMAEPETARDANKLVELSKEQGKIKPVVLKYREYKKIIADIKALIGGFKGVKINIPIPIFIRHINQPILPSIHRIKPFRRTLNNKRRKNWIEVSYPDAAFVITFIHPGGTASKDNLPTIRPKNVFARSWFIWVIVE